MLLRDGTCTQESKLVVSYETTLRTSAHGSRRTARVVKILTCFLYSDISGIYGISHLCAGKNQLQLLATTLSLPYSLVKRHQLHQEEFPVYDAIHGYLLGVCVCYCIFLIILLYLWSIFISHCVVCMLLWFAFVKYF